VKVAIAHPTYWPEVRRGAERMSHELAAGLGKRGHAARIVTTHPGRPSTRVEDGVPVVRGWRAPDGRLQARRYELYLPAIPPTALALARGEDDVVCALHPTSGAAAAWWSARTGRPAVFAYMGIPHRPGLANRRARLALIERSVRGSAGVTALSRAAADAFARTLGVDARVIPAPVDLDAFAVGTKRTEHPSVICAADPDEPRKRVALLREAWPAVRRAHPGARLLLDRRAAADPAAGIEAVDLDDRAALAARYGAAWVSVLPSWGEAFGLVLAEALACGTPVVGSDRDGIPDVVGRDGAVGRLFAGDAPGPLADALLEAIDLSRDPSARQRCRARAERFSAARVAADYEALFTELGAGARG
jgi:glycosyltransferase involved in cell wall biosynthesis